MKILVVNPNTTLSMTEKIGEAARSVAAPGTEITAVSPDKGPVSIEGHYDEAYCVPGVVEQVLAGAAEGYDGFVVACFDDPGLHSCRTAVAQPVVGICEAAMHAATMIAASFSVVSTLARSIPVIEELGIRYGMERRMKRVWAADIPVLALEEEGSDAKEKVRAAVLRAIEEDRSEAVILGCAGMADLTAWLTRETGVPVLDGVASAVKMAEGLVALGLGTSKVGGYASPRPKTYTGAFSQFAPGSPTTTDDLR
ncbi:MAG: aspartate/glutamate racemase family protein [Geminicoccaceae bacterium]